MIDLDSTSAVYPCVKGNITTVNGTLLEFIDADLYGFQASYVK